GVLEQGEDCHDCGARFLVIRGSTGRRGDVRGLRPVGRDRPAGQDVDRATGVHDDPVCARGVVDLCVETHAVLLSVGRERVSPPPAVDLCSLGGPVPYAVPSAGPATRPTAWVALVLVTGA